MISPLNTHTFTPQVPKVVKAVAPIDPVWAGYHISTVRGRS